MTLAMTLIALVLALAILKAVTDREILMEDDGNE